MSAIEVFSSGPYVRPMPVYEVSLNISAVDFERLYRGQASTVLARAADGRSIQFPARALRPFVTAAGIRGWFAIETDQANRLIAVRRKT